MTTDESKSGISKNGRSRDIYSMPKWWRRGDGVAIGVAIISFSMLSFILGGKDGIFDGMRQVVIDPYIALLIFWTVVWRIVLKGWSTH